MERRRGTGRGLAIAARGAMATETSEASVRETRFRVNPGGASSPLRRSWLGLRWSAFVAMWAPGGDRGTRVPIAKRPHSRAVVAAGGARPGRAPRSTHPSPPGPVSPAVATALEARGHGLLEAGRYGNPVPVLNRAVLATGETLGACLEPASSTVLTYAYALYDLGRAVRLSGESQAAVPILERRLQIDNQRWIVDAELHLGRRGIS